MPFAAKFGHSPEDLAKDRDLEDLLMDEYARSYGHEPTENWILVVHPDDSSVFYPFDDATQMWCCEHKRDAPPRPSEGRRQRDEAASTGAPRADDAISQIMVTPQVLTWDASAEVLRHTVEKEFEVLLYESLCRAGCEEQALATPPEGTRLAMTAPRVARLLLWPRTSQQARTWRLLERAFSAERAVLGVEDGCGFSGWTADCRARVRPNGQVAWQSVLSGTFIPLDLRSPHARSLDLLGGSRIVCPPRLAPADDMTQEAITRVEEAWRSIRATPGTVADCVAAWTRVVVVQFDGSGQFWSGSNGQYIGRVLLVNPHLHQTPVADVADALVREAIYSFLSMRERAEPWVHDASLHTDAAAVVSPWSGNPLPVGPFLRECFVWYGLTMFWGEHVNGNIFGEATAQRMLVRALRGFCGQNFADILWPWHDQIRSELIDLLTDMQRSVRWLVE